MNLQLINHYGNIVENKEEFIQFHDELITNRYDSNFILFKIMPTVEKFNEVEQYLKTFHQSFNQNHLKFIFPPNEKLSIDLRECVIKKGYDIGILEMYSIKPDYFNGKLHCPNACWVTEENFDEFLELQFKEDLRFGLDYATAKVSFLGRLSLREDWRAVMVYEGNKAVGSLELIVKQNTVEIDNLFIEESYRNKGYATQLQAFVMKEFKNKMVILVADSEDTPKHMYIKQGYHFSGFQYEILKIGI